MTRVKRVRTEPARQARGAGSCLQHHLLTELHRPDALSCGTSQIPPTLKLIIAGATSLLSADMVIVRIMDEDNNLRLVASSGPDVRLPSLRRVGVAFSGLAAGNCAPVVSEDCCSDPRLDSNAKKVAQEAALRSFIAVPIVDRFKTVGSLAVGTRRPTRFSHCQIERLSFFANHAASALQDAPSCDYIDRLIARHDRAVDDLGVRIARIERALAVRDGTAGALEDTPVHETDRRESKRIHVTDLADNALASRRVFPPGQAEYLLFFEGYRSGALAKSIDDALYPLLEEDKRHGLELVRTLACYLQNSCNMSKTARQLFVHMNTVRYRLIRCEEIGHFSLEEADTRFHLQVALRIARLAGRCTF